MNQIIIMVILALAFLITTAGWIATTIGSAEKSGRIKQLENRISQLEHEKPKPPVHEHERKLSLEEAEMYIRELAKEYNVEISVENTYGNKTFLLWLPESKIKQQFQITPAGVYTKPHLSNLFQKTRAILG